MRIYTDLECIPRQAPDARELVKATIKPPGTLKKPESIAAWWENEAPAAIEEAYRRQALDAAAGEIVSIAWCGDDCPGATVAIRAPGEDERVVLAQFFAQLQKHITDNAIRDLRGNELWESDPFFISHNASFDLGFLWRRSIALRLRPPFKLPAPTSREGKDYGCTMISWAGYRNTISLDRLCRALGIASPKGDGMDGSKVYDAWLAGDIDCIAKYNGADALAVRAIWRRLNWETSAEAAA